MILRYNAVNGIACHLVLLASEVTNHTLDGPQLHVRQVDVWEIYPLVFKLHTFDWFWSAYEMQMKSNVLLIGSHKVCLYNSNVS